MADDKNNNPNSGFENQQMQDVGKAFEKSTNMKVIPTPPPPQGQTTFAKDDPQYGQNNKK